MTQSIAFIGLGAMGYRMTRVSQMTDKYRWLYLPNGPFFWKDRA